MDNNKDKRNGTFTSQLDWILFGNKMLNGFLCYMQYYNMCLQQLKSHNVAVPSETVEMVSNLYICLACCSIFNFFNA